MGMILAVAGYSGSWLSQVVCSNSSQQQHEILGAAADGLPVSPSRLRDYPLCT
jgi:hypothetical protein